jgi:hypothetical protein
VEADGRRLHAFEANRASASLAAHSGGAVEVPEAHARFGGRDVSGRHRSTKLSAGEASGDSE